MKANGYPCWLYSADNCVLVHSEDDENALVGDWYESPADVPAPIERVGEHASMLDRAAAAGIVVDRRWGEKRLAAEVEAAEAKAVIASDIVAPDTAAPVAAPEVVAVVAPDAAV